MPRPLFASDIMYGGLGSDAMHGGPGDDAMSGAEAPASSFTNSYGTDGSKINSATIETDFGHPFNPGNVLGYNPATTKFHEFDANDPLRKILLVHATGALSKTGSGDNWLLNFDATEGPLDAQWIQGQTKYKAVPTDGNDALFGDLGPDWLVGGSGRDRLWGGWGDDLLNLDDNLDSPCGPGSTITTGCGLNQTTDTNPSWEDLGYGGAGRDVLIANTGGDRMIDWVGEFNSYLVPFSPFGMNMISDQIQPGLPAFLYGLSRSDGADMTLAARYRSDPARNGEPFAELGLVLQQDVAYNDQRGSPRDPQAGNLHGTRDVLRTSGTQSINSPGTCCDPPVGGAPHLVSAPARVDNIGQTSVPTVVSGPAGIVASYSVSDGLNSVRGSGTVGDDSMLPAVLDLSGLSDAVLTVTMSPMDGSGAVTTTIVKNTVQPGAPGLSALAYVGLANTGAATFAVTGQPGTFVYLTVSDGTLWEDGIGTLDATGTLSLALDLSRLADGSLNATVTLTNATGSSSSSTLTLVKDTIPPVAPSVSLPQYVNLVNQSAVALQVAGEAGTAVNVTVSDGVSSLAGRGTVGTGGTVALGLNLSSLKDGPLTATVSLTDAASNIGATAQASSTRNTVAPAGSFSINNNGPVIGGQLATANPNLTLQIAFSDAAGLTQMAFSTDGGATYGPWVAYASTGAVSLPAADGVYNVAVAVIDVAGNATALTRSMRLDRTPPVITASLPAPTNGTFYDVGKKITLTYGATDIDGATTSVVLDGATTITGGAIDIDTLSSGTHTIVVKSTDGLGNTSSVTITFVIHPTISGIINAVNDGASRGWIASSEASTLASQLKLALNAGSSTKVKMLQFVFMVQQQSGKSITTAYAALLVNWANDLISRL